MAFVLNNLNNVTSGAAGAGARVWAYISADDDVATIGASGYFNSVTSRLTQNDLVYAVGTDAGVILQVSSATGATTVTCAIYAAAGSIGTSQLVDDAVTNAKLADDAVSLENLDAGITPSHIVAFAGQGTTTGGSATEAIAVTGALVSDLAFVQMVDNGTNNVTIIDAVVTADTLTVTFSGDPSSDTVINFQLLRAAS